MGKNSLRRRPSGATAMLATIWLALSAAGCSTVYYSVWETLGKEKRDLLRDNVEGVREDQEDVSEQFESTLERIRAVYGTEAGELDEKYDRLKKDYERSAERADELKARIRTVEEIAADLFAEWQQEIGEISDAGLRDRSRSQLQATQGRYRELASALAKTEKGLDPVLTRFKDQVLFLKHNLNAQAILSLEAEVRDIQHDVADLLGDLRASIQEADQFIQGLPS